MRSLGGSAMANDALITHLSTMKRLFCPNNPPFFALISINLELQGGCALPPPPQNMSMNIVNQFLALTCLFDSNAKITKYWYLDVIAVHLSLELVKIDHDLFSICLTLHSTPCDPKGIILGFPPPTLTNCTILEQPLMIIYLND